MRFKLFKPPNTEWCQQLYLLIVPSPLFWGQTLPPITFCGITLSNTDIKIQSYVHWKVDRNSYVKHLIWPQSGYYSETYDYLYISQFEE